MMEWILTSSVLIAAVAVLRYLLRGKVSGRLQYALWFLVMLRLLVPFQLFPSPISMMNIQTGMAESAGSGGIGSDTSPVQPDFKASDILNGNAVSGITAIDADTVLMIIWAAGIILSSGFFLLTNVRLSRKLRRERKLVDASGYRLPVYRVEGLPSPCLFGLFQPAVYLSGEDFADARKREYMLAHEETHWNHGDAVWSAMRIVCLCLHWYNPLVWTASYLSRRDAELACDEGTLLRIGDENRTAYGRLLIETMAAPPAPAGFFCCTTSMAGDRGEMEERIRRIARRPRMSRSALGAAILAVIFLTAFTFGSSNGVITGRTAQGGMGLEQPGPGTVQYGIAKLGKEGNAAEVFTLAGQKLAEQILFDAKVKSAAWEGTDVTALDECYRIRESTLGEKQQTNYYAYLLGNGRAVLQRGENGMYSVLSRELYDQLAVVIDQGEEDTDLDRGRTGFAKSLTAGELRETEKLVRDYFTAEAPYYQGVISIETAADADRMYQNEGIESQYTAGNIIIYKVLTGRDQMDGNPQRTVSVARQDQTADWKIINQGY